jgi:hypothetical protein
MPIARLFVRTFQPGWLIVKLQEEASSKAPTGTASSWSPARAILGPGRKASMMNFGKTCSIP